MAITVDRKAVVELIQKSEHGVRSIFLLKMAGTDQQRHAMIKDMQIDPISRRMTHIDFVRVVMDEVVRVTVPVHLTGTAIGVKEGGILDWQMRELHVECLPNAIPDAIEVDITNLGAHQQVRISDLKLPEGVKVARGSASASSSASPRHGRSGRGSGGGRRRRAVAEPEVVKKGKTETEE